MRVDRVGVADRPSGSCQPGGDDGEDWLAILFTVVMRAFLCLERLRVHAALFSGLRGSSVGRLRNFQASFSKQVKLSNICTWLPYSICHRRLSSAISMVRC